MDQGEIAIESFDQAVANYIHSVTDGVIKVLSKMGISTIQSYRGAQIFEAVGIHMDVIEKYFTRTSSRLGGIGIQMIEKEVLMRHEMAFGENRGNNQALEAGDEFQYRANGEDHQYNPSTIHTLQHACRTNNYDVFKKYTKMLTDETTNLQSLRGLLKFKKGQSVAIEEVESVEAICSTL